MSDNKPNTISQDEWNEILELKQVRQVLGLTDQTVDEIINLLYGVKFFNKNDVSASKDEVFIIHIDNYTEQEPIVVARSEKTKELELIKYDN